MFVHKKYVNK